MKILIFGAGSDIVDGIINACKKAKIIQVFKFACNVKKYLNVKNYITIYKPDIVINLAGVIHFQKIKNSNIKLWKDEIETNLIGAFNIAKASVENKVKKIIFIGSLSGVIAKKNQGGYCASKRGIISLVQTLAAEGHDAYCISPGRIDTKMRDRIAPNEDKKTRLSVYEIGQLIKNCIDGKFKSGDNIIISKFGCETFIRIDKDNPWLDYTKEFA